MAQIPATAKSHRARRLIQSKLRGADWLLKNDSQLQPSERAALVLRDVPATHVPTEVIFLIPLVGPHHVNNWHGVAGRLNATLHSLLRQRNPNWRAVVCGQLRPDNMPDDPRIRFLPFAEDVQGNDKWRKLALLTAHLPELKVPSGYVMTFDADDLAHPGLVAEILTRQTPGGYLVETGYVLDQETETLALAGPRTLSKPLRKPFWKLCGSCAAIRFDLGNGAAEIDFLSQMSQHEHRMFPYLARLAGRALAPLHQPSALYLLNHGDNFGARRGRVSFKARFVQKYRISNAAEIARINLVFGL